MENPEPEITSGEHPTEPTLVPQNLKAKYQDAAGITRNVKVRSLSRGGICLEDTNCLPTGTCLRLFLKIKGKVIDAQGEVSWNAKEKTCFVHGIKFTFMKRNLQEWFNTFMMDWAAELLAQNLDFSGLTSIPVASELERRSYARLKIPLRVDIGLNEQTVLIQTQICDISEGGLCLISDLELKKEQEVVLTLWLSENDSLRLKGVVRYCAKKTRDNRTVNFHGVEFSENEKSAFERLTYFLNQKRSELDAIEITLDDIITQTELP